MTRPTLIAVLALAPALAFAAPVPTAKLNTTTGTSLVKSEGANDTTVPTGTVSAEGANDAPVSSEGADDLHGTTGVVSAEGANDLKAGNVNNVKAEGANDLTTSQAGKTAQATTAMTGTASHAH